MSSDCREINLEQSIYPLAVIEFYIWEWTNLHQHFWVITCPLMKVTTLGESTKAREWRDSGYTAMKPSAHKLKPVMVTYRWSISSIISFAALSPCIKIKYSLTQVTMWSLNVPLITWCSRSGDKSSCMSARGKYTVKGWRVWQSQT